MTKDTASAAADGNQLGSSASRGPVQVGHIFLVNETVGKVRFYEKLLIFPKGIIAPDRSNGFCGGFSGLFFGAFPNDGFSDSLNDHAGRKSSEL